MQRCDRFWYGGCNEGNRNNFVNESECVAQCGPGRYQFSGSIIGPVKQKFRAENCDYFLIHKFKHSFWVLKRTVSLRRFF